MPDPLPTISVVMPVLNFAHYVVEALESVLAQTYPPLEVIVIDDASTDGTSEIVSGFTRRGVQHILRTDQRGLFSAFNLGVERARGELIAFISADDLWLPDKLALQAALMAANPQFGYAITYCVYFTDPDYPPPPERLREAHSQVRRGQLLEATLARKTLFEQYGGFSEHYSVSADVEWFARMEARHVPMGIVEQVLMRKRLHADNTSMRDPTLTQAELLRILRDAAHERTRRDPDGAD